MWGEVQDHTDPQIMHASHLNQLPSPLSTLKPALTVEGRQQNEQVFFSSTWPHSIGWVCSSVWTLSLAGVRAGREEAKGQERKQEMG